MFNKKNSAFEQRIFMIEKTKYNIDFKTMFFYFFDTFYNFIIKFLRHIIIVIIKIFIYLEYLKKYYLNYL